MGGGAGADEENREILETKGTRVWLEARPETLAIRVGRGDRRPLVRDYSGAGRVERLSELLGERREAYAQARLRIATDERSISEVVDAILRELEVGGPAA